MMRFTRSRNMVVCETLNQWVTPVLELLDNDLHKYIHKRTSSSS
jgi:hypothetical protein